MRKLTCFALLVFSSSCSSSSTPTSAGPIGGSTGSGGGGNGVTLLPVIPGPTDDTASPLPAARGILGPIGGVLAAMGSGGQLASISGRMVTEYDSQFVPVWSTATTAELSLGAVAVDSVGDVYAAGAFKALNTLTSDAVLIKYLSTGVMMWQKTLSSLGDNDDLARAVAVGPDDSVFLMGDSDGQLPGQPIAASRGEFLAHYSGDGTLLNTTQSPAFRYPSSEFQVDSSGNGYVLFPAGASTLTATKIDANGKIIWSSSPFGGQQGIGGLAVSPDGTSIFVISSVPSGVDLTTVPEAQVGGLGQLNPTNGRMISFRPFHKDPSDKLAILADRFDHISDMEVSSDAIYVTGDYYYPARVAGGFWGGFLLKLDLAGKQQWFRAFRNLLPGGQGIAGPLPTKILIGKQDQIVILAPASLTLENMFFTFKASDGSGPL